MNVRKVTVSKSKTATPSPAKTIGVRNPAGKTEDAQCRHETVDDGQSLRRSEVNLQKATSFTFASNEVVSLPESNDEKEYNIISSATDVESLFFDETNPEDKSSNFSSEKEIPRSDEELDDYIVITPQKSAEVKLKKNIRKYSRDQLISIRSATDFSQMPPTRISAVTVTNVRSPIFKAYQRQCIMPQRRRVLTFNTDVELDEVDNAFRPTQLSQHEKKEDVKMTLTFLLNRLTPTTIQDCLNDIKSLNLEKEEDINILASTIITKSGSSVLRETYAKFCKGLVEAQIKGFKDKLLMKLTEQVCMPIHVYLKGCNDLIDAKISQSKDEKVKTMLEEDRASTIAGKREYFFRVIEFYSYLFVLDLVPTQNFCDAVKSFSNPKSQDEILALIKCLQIAGQSLEIKRPNFLDSCIGAFDNSSVKIESRVRFAISDLKNLRNRGWDAVQQLHTIPETSAAARPSTDTDKNENYPSKVNDSKTLIATENLVMSSSSGRSYFLGPTKDWSKGSKPTRIQKKNVLDSDIGKDTRASNRDN
ncbi:hypothetical protein Aperf_G00000003608 [Anoplocephala perfoliata]